MSIPVFIVNRNWLSCTEKLVSWLREAGVERIVILDNDSTYPPLLDWYDKADLEVRRIGYNAGQYIFWDLKIYGEFDSPYIMTDPDVLPADCCPKDLIQRMDDLLAQFPNAGKVGPGLRLDNLPDTFPYKQRVISEQSVYWKDRIPGSNPAAFAAPIDTTFALYGRRSPGASSSVGMRMDFPYVFEHVPWYMWPIDDEAKYYGEHCEKHVLSSVARYWKELGAIPMGERYW